MYKHSTDRNIIVETFGHRIQDYNREATVQIGVGNANGQILIIQPSVRMPERDAITGALKNFGMLKDSYRATSLIVDYNHPPNIAHPALISQNSRGEKPMTQDQINRYYLKELIEIIRPAIVVACGEEVIALLKTTPIRTTHKSIGKKFRIKDITECVFYGTINPAEYGFARAPQTLKTQGKEEWTEIANIYRKLKEKLAKERWAY